MPGFDDTRAPSRPEQRSSPRVSILGELQGEVMTFQPLAIREMSLGGAQIETTFALQLDSLHDFRLTLGDRSIVVKGCVAHCSVSDVGQEQVTYRSGVEFVDLSQRVAQVITEFLAAVRDGRRAG